MTPRRHRLAMADLAALARGGGGAGVVRALVAARRSRTLQLIRLIVDAVGEQDAVLHRAYRALAEVSRAAPASVARVLDHPAVGSWATKTKLRLDGGLPVDTGTLAGAAVAAAVHAAVPVTVCAPACGELRLPSLGVATGLPAGELEVCPGAGGTELGGAVWVSPDRSAAAPGWRPTASVEVHAAGSSARFELARCDTYETASDLAVTGEVDVPAWRAMLGRTWEVLVRHHHEVAAELAEGVRVLTPLVASSAGSTSATAEDAFGCVLLSLGPDPESMAVTLAHELRHNKLIALLDLFPLLDQVAGERFYAPWREDPRPLHGLLHGTYAYLGVTAFWREQRHHEPTPAAEHFAQTEFARWRSSTLAATATLLDSGRLTPVGDAFVSIMARTLEEWCADPVPPPAARSAARLASEHRATWRSKHHSG